MEQRIKLEQRGRNPEAIKELNLDNCRSTQPVGLTDEYCNLEKLSIINAGLVTLEGFPKLPNLKKLELSDNRISGDLNWLHCSPKLTHLNLSGNRIKDIEALKPLAELKNLKNLDLINCEVTFVENYRDEIFRLISSLKFLDGYDSNEAEDSEVEDENGFTTTAPQTTGTTINFNSVAGTDTMMKGGVSTSIDTTVQCSTGMKECENKSLEGLLQDYAATRKRVVTAEGNAFKDSSQKSGFVCSTPATPSAFPSFNFGNTTQSRPLFGTTDAFGSSNLFGTPVNQNAALFGKSVGFGTTATAAPFSNIFGSNIMGNGTSISGQNNQKRQVKTAFRRKGSSEGFNFCSAAQRSGLFSQIPGFTTTAPHTTGTSIKFNPAPGTDIVMRGGVSTAIGTRHQCITVMKEYECKSLEELRVEDFAAGRKGTEGFARAAELTGVLRLPTASNSWCSFGNTTQSKPLVGTTGTTDKNDLTCNVETQDPMQCSDTEAKDEFSISNDINILQQHLKDLLLSGDDHDVTIKIKDLEYKAHKNILRARSPVFLAMFKHQMKENNDNSISIEDCDAKAFGKFLQYVYTGEVEDLTASNALSLYYMGDKYQISGLKEMCVKCLKSSLSTENVCNVIALATKHNEADLLQCAISFFSEHLEEVLITVDWQRFLVDNPVQANELYIKAVKTSYKKIP